MEKNKEFTLIIHGPLTIYTMFTLYRYVHDFNIVVVSPRPTVKNNIITEIDNIIRSPNSNISLILYGDILKEEYNNIQNKYFHFFSVDAGLNLVTTDFVIKIRSDEFYSNLNPFMDSIKKYPEKIITNDVFFRKSNIPCHPSDHLVGGTTENIKKIFSCAKTLCEIPEESNDNLLFKITKSSMLYKVHKFVVAEQFLGIATLMEIVDKKLIESDKLTEDKVKELMREVFYIVPSEKLGVYRIRFNSKQHGNTSTPEEYFDRSYFDEATDIDDISVY